MGKTTTTIYQIYAAVQPKARAKWIEVLIVWPGGNDQITRMEAMQEAHTMYLELIEEHSSWNDAEYGFISSNYHEGD